MNGAAMESRRYPIGAEVLPMAGPISAFGRPAVRGWRSFLKTGPSRRRRRPESGSRGYFSGPVSQAKAGSLYRFRLDADSTLYPDPVSRFQPRGRMDRRR